MAAHAEIHRSQKKKGQLWVSFYGATGKNMSPSELVTRKITAKRNIVGHVNMVHTLLGSGKYMIVYDFASRPGGVVKYRLYGTGGESHVENLLLNEAGLTRRERQRAIDGWPKPAKKKK